MRFSQHKDKVSNTVNSSNSITLFNWMYALYQTWLVCLCRSWYLRCLSFIEWPYFL